MYIYIYGKKAKKCGSDWSFEDAFNINDLIILSFFIYIVIIGVIFIIIYVNIIQC